MKSEESDEIKNDKIENKDLKENFEIEKKLENEEPLKTTENQDTIEMNNCKLTKSKEIKSTEAPPSIGEKIFIIDDSEFFYSINEQENKGGICIKLEEVKPKKNIYFLFEASTKESLEKMKFLDLFDDNEQKINLLNQLFNNDKVKIIKKEDKYFMVFEIEFSLTNLVKKYEIELIRIEIYEQINNNLIHNIKYLNDIVKELKNDLNELKKVKISAEKEDSKILELNNIDINNFLDDVIKKINIKDKIIEVLNDKEVQNIQNQSMNKKILINKKEINEINELENIISEKIKVSMNELIKERLEKKEEDEKILKERIDKIENSINEKFNEINQLIEKNEKEKINELLDEKLNIYQDNMNKQKEKLDKIENDINAKFNDVNKLIQKLETEKINEIIKKEFTKTEEELKKIINNITQQIDNTKEDDTKKLLTQIPKIINETKYINYIIYKLYINKDNIGNNTRLLKQNEIYKRKFNFEIDDIIVQINDITIPFLYNNINNNYSYETDKIYEFNWNFEKEGAYIVKIIFKKPLAYCNYLFDDCKFF